jgi:hypothetical protein
MESLSPEEKKIFQQRLKVAYAKERQRLPDNPTIKDKNSMHARMAHVRYTLLKGILEQKLQKLKGQNRNLRLLDAILSVKKTPVDNRTRINLKTTISQLQQQEQSLLLKLSQQQEQDRLKQQRRWMLKLSPIRQTLPSIIQQQQEEQQQQDVIKKYLSQQFL